MRSCPRCGRDSIRNLEGTRDMVCGACNMRMFHEGNGYIDDLF